MAWCGEEGRWSIDVGGGGAWSCYVEGKVEGKFRFFVWDCLTKRLFQLSRKGGRIVKCGGKVEDTLCG